MNPVTLNYTNAVLCHWTFNNPAAQSSPSTTVFKAPKILVEHGVSTNERCPWDMLKFIGGE
jgi:hypothetical protein